MQSFVDQVYNSKVSLSGFELFHVTRESMSSVSSAIEYLRSVLIIYLQYILTLANNILYLFKVMATLLTYEVVLLQM